MVETALQWKDEKKAGKGVLVFFLLSSAWRASGCIVCLVEILSMGCVGSCGTMPCIYGQINDGWLFELVLWNVLFTEGGFMGYEGCERTGLVHCMDGWRSE